MKHLSSRIEDNEHTEQAIEEILEKRICLCICCTGHYWWPGQGEVCVMLLGGDEVPGFVCRECLEIEHDRIVAKVVNPQALYDAMLQQSYGNIP